MIGPFNSFKCISNPQLLIIKYLFIFYFPRSYNAHAFITLKLALNLERNNHACGKTQNQQLQNAITHVTPYTLTKTAPA